MKGPGDALRELTLGPWTVVPELRRLERDGTFERLEPKVMEVLVVLAQRAPEVVSREELQQAVWATEHISEDLPRRAVYALRKALGDDPRQPRYIETIPRAGYRLVAAVGRGDTEGSGDLSSAGASGEPGRSAGRRSGRLWRRTAPVALVGLLALAAVTLGLLRSPSHRPGGGSVSAAPPERVVLSPLTAQPGLEYEPALAPDGSRVAYLRASGTEDGAGIGLWVQLVGAESALLLNDEPADFDHPIESPAWSPDGTALAYRRWNEGEGWVIYRVPSLGGPERKLADLGRVEASGLTWSPDGRWLAVGLRSGENGPLAIHRIDLEDPAGLEGVDAPRPELFSDPPATIRGDVLPAWSPDGASIAFIRTVAADASELRVMPAAGGPSRSLLPGRHKLADVDWSADGRRLIVAVHDGGRHRIWSVDATTGAVEPRPELGDDTRWVSVARNGGRIVLGRARWEFRIRRHDLASGEATLVPGLSSTFYDEALDVSPDGTRLALVSTRSGSPEVWVSGLGRGAAGPMQLTSFGGGLVGRPCWSADGKSVVFDADRDGRFDLWAAALDGGAPRRLTGPPGDHRGPSMSRDGGSIYFASNRTGMWQVWRMPAAGGQATQVTRGGGYLARESPDGRWLYFTRWGAPGLWRLTSGGGEGAGRGRGRAPEEQVLGRELDDWNRGNWVVAPEGVYLVARDREHGVHLMLWSAERKAVVRRMPLQGDPVEPSLGLTPDGSAVILAELDRIVSDLVLAEETGTPALRSGPGHPVARGKSR